MNISAHSNYIMPNSIPLLSSCSVIGRFGRAQKASHIKWSRLDSVVHFVVCLEVRAKGFSSVTQILNHEPRQILITVP